MIIKYRITTAKKKSLHFKPEVELFSDGSLMIRETTAWQNGKEYNLPPTVMEPGTKELWVNINERWYGQIHPNISPGSFRMAIVEGEDVYISLYEETKLERLIDKVKRFINDAFS